MTEKTGTAAGENTVNEVEAAGRELLRCEQAWNEALAHWAALKTKAAEQPPSSALHEELEKAAAKLKPLDEDLSHAYQRVIDIRQRTARKLMLDAQASAVVIGL